MTLVVGLVAEGVHDEVLLGPLITAEVRRILDTDVRIKLLSPIVDETGRSAAGGWKEVDLWCQNHCGDNIATHFTPIFEGDQACDLIIVHVDGDSVNGVCRSTTGVEPLKMPVAVGALVDHMTRALGELLVLDRALWKVSFAVPVQSAESWILASEGEMHDAEEMDAKKEFRRTHSREKFGSMLEFYRLRGTEAAKKTNNIFRQCRSYQTFSSELENILRLNSPEFRGRLWVTFPAAVRTRRVAASRF